MDWKKLLLVMGLGLALLTCGCQGGTATEAAPLSTEASMGSKPATRVPALTGTPVPANTATPLPPDLPVLDSPVLARIDFQDENNGWGIAVNDGGHVLRTVDGGRTWLNASPPGAGPIGYSTSLVVLDASHAWVLIPDTDFFSGTLHRTSDGGVTWSSNPVPFGGGFLQFLDANTGRALAERGAGGGSEAVELFQSSDGGATWVSVFHNDPSQAGSSDSLPPGGIKNGMTFLNADTGWVTGSIPQAGDVYLYESRDGGASWAQQALPLPAGYADYQYTSQAPVFFGKDGFLPLMIHKADMTDFTFYTSHDGGLTWSGDPGEAGKVIKPGLAVFADALHGWCWDGGAKLYQTLDGAQTWGTIPANLELSGRLAQVEFVPAPSGGFTGWALTRADDAGQSQLFRSTDGSTWLPLIP
jgi:photosystem II stability/assembly factor-like uncharacterized protein